MFNHASSSGQIFDKKRLTRPFSNRLFVTGKSNVFTDDFRAVSSKFSDYSGDHLVSSNVPLTDAPSFDDTSISSLDSVDNAAVKILNSEGITKKSTQS